MLTKNALIAFALLASITACGSQKKSKETVPVAPPPTLINSDQNTGVNDKEDDDSTKDDDKKNDGSATDDTKMDPAQPPVVQPLDIIGNWGTCTADGETSSGINYAFKADGSLDVSAKAYKDKACTSSYTQAEIEKTRQEITDAYVGLGFPLEFAIEAANNQVAFFAGFSIAGTYTTGIILPSLARELDISFADGESVFVSYKIEGNKLSIAGTCDSESVTEGECQEISGDSAANRSVDFTNSQVSVLERK